MNRLEESELVAAMTEVHRLRAALEAAERERDLFRQQADDMQDWIKSYRADSLAERDALKEQVAWAREALHGLRSIASGAGEAGFVHQIDAALARLDQREPEHADWTDAENAQALGDFYDYPADQRETE